MISQTNHSQNDQISNAVDYIRKSSIYSDFRFSWVLPLIEKILSDSLEDSDVNNLIQGNEAEKPPITTSSVALEMSYTIKTPTIRKINSIEKIYNLGLLEISTPVPMKDGLNIIYGRNGAGKSSLYLSLCKALGKAKKAYPNISKAGEPSYCALKYLDEDGTENDLNWNSGIENKELPVMIFDGQISQFLVEQDQANKFEIAHLQLEYFPHLHKLYADIERELTKKIFSLQDVIKLLHESLIREIPFIFESNLNLPSVLTKAEFSIENQKTLQDLQTKYSTLYKDNTEAVIRNLNTTADLVSKILLPFRVFSEDSDPTFKYTEEYINEINQRIKNYATKKNTLKENKIANLLPLGWLKDDVWNQFIQKSIDFVESLEESQKNKYTSKACLYCQQPLVSSDAKTLIESYNSLLKKHNDDLGKDAAFLSAVMLEIEECIKEANLIPSSNIVIQNELAELQDNVIKLSNHTKLVEILDTLKKSIEESHEIILDADSFSFLQFYYNEYESIGKIITKRVDELTKLLANKKSALESLNRDIQSLTKLKSLKENKHNIENYLRKEKLLEDEKRRKSELLALKGITSRLETNFLSQTSFQKFKSSLQEEYKSLGFYPNNAWTIKSITPGGVNKRCYGLNDRRLAEIFSDGEKKLHSLADFFAECRVIEYKGLYIFDDPVTSLDEENIERVAERILNLVDEGNQVIVFTHHLFFLNELIELSGQDKISEVERDRDNIIMEYNVDKRNKSELKKVLIKIDKKMVELSEISQHSEDDISPIYDLISRYLEYYVELVLLKDVVHRHRSHIRMTSLKDLKLEPDIIQEIIKIQRRTSRKGVRHSQPDGVVPAKYDDLLKDYKYLKEKLKY